eukprot:scaffold327382_cov22-Prasinocladus_malaysianus.AAC.1
MLTTPFGLLSSLRAKLRYGYPVLAEGLRYIESSILKYEHEYPPAGRDQSSRSVAYDCTKPTYEY